MHKKLCEDKAIVKKNTLSTGSTEEVLRELRKTEE